MERSEGESPSDGLEIISIGALYGGGPWEKKYWSCSRGKDRYPYPIGYHAIRTHAGNAYKMEICEGLKGPLFMITSMGGDSCTGQTPDITWEHFQKRSGPRVKTWHAKRLSCKIDGVELFGFRNPHVQRLLRELAANANGMAEQSSIHPSFCNGASVLEQEFRSPESCIYPDLLPYLGKRQSTGKRSRKQKNRAKSCISGANQKRFRTQELLDDGKVIAEKGNRGNHDESSPSLSEKSIECEIPTHSRKESVVSVNGEIPSPVGLRHHGKGTTLASSTSDQNCVVYEELGTISAPNSAAAPESGNDTILVKDDLLLESPKISNHFLEAPAFPHQQSKLVGARASQVACAASILSNDNKKLIDRLTDMNMQVNGSLVAAKESNEEFPVLTEFDKDFDYYAPDTLDLQDNIADSEGCKGGPCNKKNLEEADELLGNSISHIPQVVAKDKPEQNCEGGTCSLKCMDAMHKTSQENGGISIHLKLPQDIVLSKEPIMGSQPEEEIGSSGASHASSGKSDFDSVGQDFIKSMMTVLLPQALPLLKKTSKKKKGMVENAGVPFTKCDPCLNLEGMKSLEETDGAHHVADVHVADVISEGELAAQVPISYFNTDREEKIQVFHTVVVDSLERVIPADVKSVIPDNFEEEQCACSIINQRTLNSDFRKIGSALLYKSACDVDISGLLGNADEAKESSSYHLGNGKQDEIAMVLDNPPEKHAVLASLAIDYKSTSEHILSEGEVNNTHMNGDGSIILSETIPTVKIPVDKEITIVSSGTEDMTALEALENVAISHGNSQNSHNESVLNVMADKPPESPDSRSIKTVYTPDLFSTNPDDVHLKEAALRSSSSCKNFRTMNIEIPETFSHHTHTTPTDLQRTNILCRPANSNTQRLSTTADARDTDFNTYRLCTTADPRAANFDNEEHVIPPMQSDDKTTASGMGNSLFSTHKTDAATYTRDSTRSIHLVRKHPCSPLPSQKYDSTLSESIVVRNVEHSGIPWTNSVANTLHLTEIGRASAHDETINRLLSSTHENELERQQNDLDILKGLPQPDGMLFNMEPNVLQNQAPIVQVDDDKHLSDFGPPTEKHQVDIVSKMVVSYKPAECTDDISCILEQGRVFPDENGSDVRETLAYSDLGYRKIVNNESSVLSHSKINPKGQPEDDFFLQENKICDQFNGFIELVGCYVHPTPILSVLLSMKDDNVHICALCGVLGEKKRTLFIYEVPAKRLSEKCPSFLGYTSIMLPISKCGFNQIAFERSGLQFTPDGQSLVLLNSIKVPCCREQNIDCLCSACTTDCHEENAVKVVRVQLGFVSVVVKFSTVGSIYCMVVCEPCYLVVAKEGGRLHVWIMNLAWSACVDEFTLPSFDYICPSLVELRRIPKCASLVIGHNGTGGFGLWDISKRTLLSSFSSPGISISHVFPVGLFGWQMKFPVSTGYKLECHIEEIIAATEMWFSRVGENSVFLPNGEDIAIWLLVSTASSSNTKLDHPGSDCNDSPVRHWRLALLVKKSVIVGSILDPRASAAVASAGHGIIGTCDGLVYMWELSTGKKLANLKYLKGGISCIATDATSGAVAVAGNECQLLLYVHSPKAL